MSNISMDHVRKVGNKLSGEDKTTCTNTLRQFTNTNIHSQQHGTNDDAWMCVRYVAYDQFTIQLFIKMQRIEVSSVHETSEYNADLFMCIQPALDPFI